MLFDKSKGAFRAGEVTGTQWDNTNRGDYSVAMGLDNVASGIGSASLSGSTNDVSGDVSVITGGALNNLDGASGFIGGGALNDISSTAGYNIIVGGGSNSITGTSEASFIGGGGKYSANAWQHEINDSNHAVIVGGGSNKVFDSIRAAILGGFGNIVGVNGSGFAAGYGTIAGGSGNQILSTTAAADYSFVGGGEDNLVTDSQYASILGGQTNTVTATHGTVVGGQNNTADSSHGTAQGYYATTDSYGTVSHASGRFAADGDAQGMHAVWRIQTTDGTTNVEAFLNGSSARFDIDSDATYTFSILGVARRTDADGESAGYKFEGVIDNNAGTTALVGSVTKTVLAEDTAAWDCQVTADDANDSLKIDVTGEGSKTINWVFYGRLVKVTG